MIRNTNPLALAASTILIAASLAGCGGSSESENAANTAAPADSSTQNAVSEAPEAPEAPKAEAAPPELAGLFPEAQMSRKPFPLGASDASHLGKMGRIKFSGEEGKWEVYEASRDGARVGLAMMTHSDLPKGGDMHIALAVGRDFKVASAWAVEAPDAVKMQAFINQMKGKSHDDAFKVGLDLKPVPGIKLATAQIAADAVHKGLLILEENFDAAHGAEEAQESQQAAHGAHGHTHAH